MNPPKLELLENPEPSSEPTIVPLTDVLRETWRISKCKHEKSYTLDPDTGDVYCRECNQAVSPFHALLSLSRRWADIERRMDGLRHEEQKLKTWVPRRRALRFLEQALQGNTMNPCCPHCHRMIDIDRIQHCTMVDKKWYGAPVAIGDIEDWQI